MEGGCVGETLRGRFEGDIGGKRGERERERGRRPSTGRVTSHSTNLFHSIIIRNR